MTMGPGDTVWIPCEVTSSAFADERKVSIELPVGHWAGFVAVKQLRDEIVDGRTAVRATIVRAPDGELAARLPGQTSRRQYVPIVET